MEYYNFSNLTNSSGTVYPCDLPPDFPPSLNIHPSINYIQGAIALLTGIIGFFLNLFVFVMILKYRALHRRLMFIAVHIVTIELLYSLLVTIAIFISSVTRMWVLGDVLCNFFGIVNDGFAIFRFTMTFIQTLDRCITVFFPFFYAKHSKKILIILLFVVYLITFLRVILPITRIMSCYVYVSTNKICTAFSSCSTGCYYFVLVSIIVIICFGAILPFILYMILFTKAYLVRRKIKATAGIVNHQGHAAGWRIKLCSRRNAIHPSSVDVPPSGGSEAYEEGKACEESEAVEAPHHGRVDQRNAIHPSSIEAPSNQEDINPDQPPQKPKVPPPPKTNVTITMFILLLSVVGCTFPAFTLYFVQVITLRRNGPFFITIMLLGRTSFNSIPVCDAIAIIRDKQFRETAGPVIKKILIKLKMK